eukprot:m.137667 g.137667  ORF g.137667 m.137667 type:complete len:306 (+) comp16059_c0_seq1:197-1114(+)
MTILVSTTIATVTAEASQSTPRLQFAWSPSTLNNDNEADLQALSSSSELQIGFSGALQDALTAINASIVLEHATQLLLVRGGQIKLKLNKAQISQRLASWRDQHTASGPENEAVTRPLSDATPEQPTLRCQCRITLPRWLEILRLSPAAGPVTGGTLVQVEVAGMPEGCEASSIVATFGDDTVPVLSLSDNCATCIAPPHRPGPVTFELRLPRLGQAATTIYTYFDPHIMGRECVPMCLPVRLRDSRDSDWIRPHSLFSSGYSIVAWSEPKWTRLPSYMGQPHSSHLLNFKVGSNDSACLSSSKG